MAGNWFAPCPKNSNKSHYPDCLDMPICPWCRTPNPAFPQGPDPTPPQALQPPAPPLQLEQPTTLVQSTEESSLVTPAVRQLVYSPQPPSKPKSLPKRTNLGQFGQSHRSVTTTPAVGTCQSGSSLLSTASFVIRLKIPPVANSRDSRYEQPSPDAKPACGILRHCVEVLHY